MSTEVKSIKLEGSALDRALAALIESIVITLCYIPRRLMHGIAVSAAFVLYYTAKKFNKRIFANTLRVYGIPSQSYFAKQFAWQIITHQVVCILETVRIIYRRRGFRVIGLEELRACIAKAENQGYGHMIITGHVGSWEMVAFFGKSVSQKPLHVLAKPSRSRSLSVYLENLRQKMGTPVLWNHRKSLMRQVLSALKKGESVGFVMDQKPEGRKGPVVNFLGTPTSFVGGPASIAVKTQCAVISVFCLREGPMEYRILSRMLLPGGHQNTDELGLSQLMADEIGEVIRAYPEQWLWNYKRW